VLGELSGNTRADHEHLRASRTSAAPLLGSFLVRLDQRVVVALVGGAVGVAGLAHRHILAGSGVVVQADRCVPSALVVLDHRHASGSAELLEPLGDVVGVPRLAGPPGSVNT